MFKISQNASDYCIQRDKSYHMGTSKASTISRASDTLKLPSMFNTSTVQRLTSSVTDTDVNIGEILKDNSNKGL